MKKIKKWFLTGLILLLPIGVSLYFIYVTIIFLDGFLGTPIESMFGITIPGLGIISAVLFIFLIGFITSNLLGKKFMHSIENLFCKIPLFRTIYSPVRDITKTLIRDEDAHFLKVVLVEFPLEGSFSIGFITNENVDLGGEPHNAIFVPTTPNPTSGFVIYKKPKYVRELDISVEEGIKLVVAMAMKRTDPIPFKENQ